MNKIILDGRVQKDTKLFSDIASFNISAVTGKFTLIDGKQKNRFTFIRVIYPHPIDEYIEDIVQPNSFVRIYGKIDSERYVTPNGKNVYNKVICADKIVRVVYNEDINDFDEVI